MGLDNMIEVKHIDRKDVPSWLPYDRDSNKYLDADTIELCYWRKCWGVRNEIMSVFHFEDGKHDGYYKFDIEDMNCLRRIIRSWMNEKKWDRESDSIWQYDEIFDSLVDQYICLSWFAEYWLDHPEIEVVFVDSY